MSTLMQNPFLNVAQAADLVGCTEGRVRQLLIDGVLDGFKINGKAWAIDPKSARKLRDSVAKTGRPRKNQKSDD